MRESKLFQINYINFLTKTNTQQNPVRKYVNIVGKKYTLTNKQQQVMNNRIKLTKGKKPALRPVNAPFM